MRVSVSPIIILRIGLEQSPYCYHLSRSTPRRGRILRRIRTTNFSRFFDFPNIDIIARCLPPPPLSPFSPVDAVTDRFER